MMIYDTIISINEYNNENPTGIKFNTLKKRIFPDTRFFILRISKHDESPKIFFQPNIIILYNKA